jgi:3-dehydroquinate synthase|tara:strand:+ start:11766 stop:12821 length:1056 start_codon:yes stop_codon:yes gene_type:complete
MKEIKSKNYSIYFDKNRYNKLFNFIKSRNYSKIFIHLDTNTENLCLNVFINQINKLDYQTIISEAGEENKNIESCVFLWNKLSELKADRKSIIINLGGGVVGDMGGFVASTFKRGVDYVNIPTTLLSMVDASIGGKTGVDLGVLKNQIGTFYDPKMVIIDPLYLETLSDSELASGYAEIFKHSIISKTNNFNSLISKNIDFKNIDLIRESIEIKNNIVLIDKKENKERKALNYGHTLGHAIESYFLKSKKQLLHGEAISIGIILASFISLKKAGLSKNCLKNIKNHILKIYKKISFSENDIQEIIKLLIHDKKNSYGKINFVLVKNIGTPIYDIEVNNDLIIEAFKYYSSI